jgi:hypothetical protein
MLEQIIAEFFSRSFLATLLDMLELIIARFFSRSSLAALLDFLGQLSEELRK